ncbi:MAG: isoaspartyl peptidase/L-asparaginase [Alphaproteobacteria bacterium]
MKKFFLRVFAHEQGLKDAARELLAGQHRHDVLEKAVRVLERDPKDDSVGFNGFPNILGKMELDGAFMDGNTRMLGAVAAVEHYLPVRVARKLMEEGMHTFLVGAGAEMFAREVGLKRDITLSPLQRKKWEKEVKPLLKKHDGRLMDVVRKLADFEKMRHRDAKARNFDTTVMIASDGTGMSAAASTSGWPYKYPGRVGDTPVTGAGLYVDSRYGGAACIYTGEMSMRGAVARFMVDQLANDKTPRQAVHAAIKDLAALQGGLLRTLALHAIDAKGRAHAAVINADQDVRYSYWVQGMKEPEFRAVESVDVPALHGGTRKKTWRHLAR